MSRETEMILSVLGVGLLVGVGVLVIGMALGLPYETAKLAAGMLVFGLFMLALLYGTRDLE